MKKSMYCGLTVSHRIYFEWGSSFKLRNLYLKRIEEFTVNTSSVQTRTKVPLILFLNVELVSKMEQQIA